MPATASPTAVAERAECREVFRKDQRLMGDVEREHRHRNSRREDDVGRLRIDVDVELGNRGGVASGEEAAPHEGDLSDLGNDAGLGS